MGSQHDETLRRREDLPGRCRPHFFQTAEAGVVHQGLALLVIAFLRYSCRRGEASRSESSATLDDGLCHESLCFRADQEVLHAHRSCALSEDGDVGRISAESPDVVFYPLEGSDLVHETIVTALALFGGQFRVGQESEDAQAVVDGDEDDAAGGPFVPVHGNLVAISVLEGASVDPEGHGKARLLTQGTGRGPDIQGKAVLVHVGRALPVEFVSIEGAGRIAGLPGDGTEGITGDNPLPGLDGLRFGPSQIAHRRLCIADAAEHADIGLILRGHALQQAPVHFDHALMLGTPHAQGQKNREKSFHGSIGYRL